MSSTTGEEFIAGLDEEARSHRAVRHPYLQQLAKGDVPDVAGAMRDFGFQYSAYCSDFVRYLTATISQLEAETHRKALLKNLVEESGRIDAENAAFLKTIDIDLEWVDGVPHTDLFKRYLESSGVDEAYRRSHDYSDEAQVWRSLFYAVCAKEGPARALGAMGLGTENIVKYIYRPVIEAIKSHLNISARERVFFDLHAALDDQHGDALMKIASDYAGKEENRKPIREGMLMALGLRNAFFDSLQARACAMKPARSDH